MAGKKDVEVGACGAEVGAQVDVSSAMKFDRAQQVKAKQEADDAKQNRDKLIVDQGSEIARLTVELEQAKKPEAAPAAKKPEAAAK